MKLRWKLFIFLIIVSVVPTAVITIFAHNRYTAVVDSQVAQMYQNVFDNAIAHTQTSLDNVQNVIDNICFYSNSEFAMINSLRKFTGSSYTSFDVFKANQTLKFLCQNLIYFSENINGIFIFTPHGEVLGYGYGGNIDIMPNYSPTNDKWYEETIALNGDIYISELSKKDFLIHSTPSISFSKAIYDVYDNTFYGVIYIDYSPELFNLEYANSIPDILQLSLRNSKIPGLSGKYYATENWNKQAELPGNHLLEYKYDVGGLKLIGMVNYSLLYKDFNQTRYSIILICILCIVIFIVFSYFISGYITKPIVFLSKKMQHNKSCELLKDTSYLQRHDEIGLLFNEYNTMLEKQRDYIKIEYENKCLALDAQMKVLASQINSHFLFNTLESINSIAELEGIDRLSTMVLALGNMLRYSIKTVGQLVTVADEIANIKDYVAIQSIRFNNRFHLVLDIPPHIYQCKTLKLILQPLVENALYHGLNYCNHGDCITISAKADLTTLTLDVKDNGKGISPEELEKIQKLLNADDGELQNYSSKLGIGLRNIHKRIYIYYGQGYGLTITSELEHGTCISVQVAL